MFDVLRSRPSHAWVERLIKGRCEIILDKIPTMSCTARILLDKQHSNRRAETSPSTSDTADFTAANDGVQSQTGQNRVLQPIVMQE
jgi:hypothetical protein